MRLAWLAAPVAGAALLVGALAWSAPEDHGRGEVYRQLELFADVLSRAGHGFVEYIPNQTGEDPLGVVRSAEENAIIELPQEREKYGKGDAFLAESIAMSHVRYSPLKPLVLAMFGMAGA